MILPLIFTAWIFALWLVAGICAAARFGDRDQLKDARADGRIGPGSLGWEQLEVSVHANIGSGSPVGSDGIAA